MFIIKQLGIAALSSAAVLIPVFLCLRLLSVYSAKQAAAGFLFSLYLSVVFSTVGLPSLAYWEYLDFRVNLNLIPLIGIPADFKNAVMNVIMFVPLGILLPLFWEKYRSASSTACFGFCMSLFIELLQMFTGRATDIDDLITNVTGTLIGYAIACCFLRKESQAIGAGCSVGALFCITCLANFFVQPYLVSLLEMNF